MPNLVVIAVLKCKTEHIETVKKGLQGLVAPTLQEAGCLKYDLHQDLEDPNTFIFVEEWESAEHLKQHGASDHIKAFGAASKGMMESRKLHMMNQV